MFVLSFFGIFQISVIMGLQMCCDKTLDDNRILYYKVLWGLYHCQL